MNWGSAMCDAPYTLNGIWCHVLWWAYKRHADWRGLLMWRYILVRTIMMRTCFADSQMLSPVLNPYLFSRPIYLLISEIHTLFNQLGRSLKDCCVRVVFKSSKNKLADYNLMDKRSLELKILYFFPVHRRTLSIQSLSQITQMKIDEHRLMGC